MPKRETREEVPLPYETPDIGPASYVAYTVGFPHFLFDANTSRVLFSFDNRDQALEAVLAYESGESCPAKPLMAIRAYLYREVSRVTAEHRRGHQ